MDALAATPPHAGSVPRALTRGGLGALWGVVLLPALLFALLLAPVKPATAVAGWTARRLTWIDGTPRTSLPERGRLFGMHAVMLLLGILNLCVLALLAIGVVSVVQVVAAAATGAGVEVFDAPPGRVTWATVAVFALPGIVLLFLAASGIGGVQWLERRTWSSFNIPGFLDAIERVAAGGTAFDPEVIRQLLAAQDTPPPRFSGLSDRERSVLDLLAQGHSNAAIAERLHMSLSGVEKHINTIFARVGIVADGRYNRRVLAVLAYLGATVTPPE